MPGVWRIRALVTTHRSLPSIVPFIEQSQAVAYALLGKAWASWIAFHRGNDKIDYGIEKRPWTSQVEYIEGACVSSYNTYLRQQ